MASAGAFIKESIGYAVTKVVKNKAGGFEKSDIVQELRKNKPLDAALKDIHAKYNGQWQLGDLLMQQINAMIGQALGARDENRIRIYECYSVPGKRQRRWLPLRTMTRAMLLNVMRETRVQERQLQLKGEAYYFFIDELDKLDENATVADVYDIAAPKIVARRSDAA